jgi:hypothetical protein
MPHVRTPGASRVTEARWQAVRAAVRDVTDRFARLVAQAPDPSAMATADWTVIETAVHVTGIAWCYTAMMAPVGTPLPIEGISALVAPTTVDNIHEGINAALLRCYPERDPDAVVLRLRESVAEVLAVTAGADPERLVPWLGAANLPFAGMLAHLTNELLQHGQDIARALRVPWEIPQEYAALFFELFVVEILRNGPGNILDDDRPVRPGRIAVEFRSAYTEPVTLVVTDGRVSVEEPGRDNDVRLWFRPAAMSLVLFHRIGRPRAALTGQLVVWGRRPWLLAPFLRKVRLP